MGQVLFFGKEGWIFFTFSEKNTTISVGFFEIMKTMPYIGYNLKILSQNHLKISNAFLLIILLKSMDLTHYHYHSRTNV